MQLNEEQIFEQDVRALARAMYPSFDSAHAAIEGGRERDCVIYSGDHIVVIEATTSRRMDKIRQDCKKTQKLIGQIRKDNPSKLVIGFVITKHDPTAEQASAAKEFRRDNIFLEGFDQFRVRAYDAMSYVNLRSKYPFGSAREPSGSRSGIDLSKLIDLDLIDKNSGTLFSASLLIESVRSNLTERAILLGDFGSGKSTTMFQMFSTLAKDISDRRDYRLPIFLNLRDHSGQEDPSEALIRHATRIGYAQPHQLVAAFRAGHCVIFLDGVDEMSPFVRLPADSRRLRAIRRKTVTLVRRFINEADNKVSIFLSSRAQYFDSQIEMSEALGLSENWKVLTLNEFSFDQVQKFIRFLGLEGELPSWLPSRPLLLAYLAASGLLKEVLASGEGADPVGAWSAFLEMICRREGERLDLDPATVRLVIERVATLAGKILGGLGPIDAEEILRSLTEVTGTQPDEGAEQLVLRLPGLGPAPDGSSKRQFIDDALADAARAGDIGRYISSPYGKNLELLEGTVSPLKQIGAGLVWRALGTQPSVKLLSQALDNLASVGEPWALQMSMTQILICSEISIDSDKFFSPVVIMNGYFDSISFRDLKVNLQFIKFSSCLIQDLYVGEGPASILPHFEDCIISRIHDRAGPLDLPTERFSECRIELYGRSLTTTAQILRTDLDPMVAVVCTCVEKLFLQPGRGRDESAFPRGLDVRHRPLVAEALELLEREGFASPYRTSGKTIWIPNRAKTAEVREILAAPSTSKNPLLVRARAVSGR